MAYPIPLTQFRAIYCSGVFIPEPEAVVALSLLFEKVYLPNNIGIICEFVKHYRVRNKEGYNCSISIASEDGEDPFANLTPDQRESALNYVAWGIQFSRRNSSLFGEVLESEMFSNTRIINTELTEKGPPGKLDTYHVTFTTDIVLENGDVGHFPKLIEQGYVPVVGRFHRSAVSTKYVDDLTAKQLATLLAMKSIEIVLPQTKSAPPDIILEARKRLGDQLPVFWSAMLKFSVEIKKRIAECKTHYEASRETTDLVDTLIRPALIDLSMKLEKDRKDWFYKILSPIQRGLRLLAGNPPVTQQQLITSSLILASDTCMTVVENMRAIESLKQEAGLTYLLDLSRLFNERGQKV